MLGVVTLADFLCKSQRLRRCGKIQLMCKKRDNVDIITGLAIFLANIAIGTDGEAA